MYNIYELEQVSGKIWTTASKICSGEHETINSILDEYPENVDWHIEPMHPWL